MFIKASTVFMLIIIWLSFMTAQLKEIRSEHSEWRIKRDLMSKSPRTKHKVKESHRKKIIRNRSTISTNSPPELTPENIDIGAHEKEIKRWKPPELIPEKIVKADRRTLNQEKNDVEGNARELIPETITIVKKHPIINANNLPGANEDSTHIPSLGELDVDRKISKEKKHKHYDHSVFSGHNLVKRPSVNPMVAFNMDKVDKIKDHKPKKSKKDNMTSTKKTKKQANKQKSVSITAHRKGTKSMDQQIRNIADAFEKVDSKTEGKNQKHTYRHKSAGKTLQTSSVSHDLITTSEENEGESDPSAISEDDASADGSGADGVNVDEINAFIAKNETQQGDAGGPEGFECPWVCFWTCHSYCPKECCFNPFHCASVCQTFCAPVCHDKCCAPGARKLGKLQLNLYKHHVGPEDQSQTPVKSIDTSALISGIGDISGTNPMPEYMSKEQGRKKEMQLRRTQAVQALSDILIDPNNSCPNFCSKICAPGLCGPDCCQRSALPNVNFYHNTHESMATTATGDAIKKNSSELAISSAGPMRSKLPTIVQNQNIDSKYQTKEMAKLEDHMAAAANVLDTQKSKVTLSITPLTPNAVPKDHADAVSMIIEAQQKAQSALTTNGARKHLRPKHILIHIYGDKSKAPMHKINSITFSSLLDRLPKTHADASSFLREAQKQHNVNGYADNSSVPKSPPKEHLEAIAHSLLIQDRANKNAAFISKIAKAAPAHPPKEHVDSAKKVMNNSQNSKFPSKSLEDHGEVTNQMIDEHQFNEEIPSSTSLAPADIPKSHGEAVSHVLDAYQKNNDVVQSTTSLAPSNIPNSHEDAISYVLTKHQENNKIIQSNALTAPADILKKHKEAATYVQDANKKVSEFVQTSSSSAPSYVPKSHEDAVNHLRNSQQVNDEFKHFIAPSVPYNAKSDHQNAVSHILDTHQENAEIIQPIASTLQSNEHNESVAQQNIASASNLLPSIPLLPMENVLEALRHPPSILSDQNIRQENANNLAQAGQKFVENVLSVNNQANFITERSAFGKSNYCPPICRSSCIDQCPNQCCSLNKKSYQ